MVFDVWALPKKPLGAAEETNGCRRGNRWVPWEKPMVSAEETAGNRMQVQSKYSLNTQKKRAALIDYTLF